MQVSGKGGRAAHVSRTRKPTVASSYYINCFVLDARFGCCPNALIVHAAETSPRHCEASGAGLTSAVAGAGVLHLRRSFACFLRPILIGSLRLCVEPRAASAPLGTASLAWRGAPSRSALAAGYSAPHHHMKHSARA